MSTRLRQIAYRVIRLYWRIFRPLTLGSRALVVRGGQVLLVRLTYAKGWHLPGGGVGRGESFHQAVIRELREECAIGTEEPKVFGVYYTDRAGKRDHIVIFEVKEFDRVVDQPPDPEIAEQKFFDLRNLPPDTSGGTKRRIAEYLNEREISSEW